MRQIHTTPTDLSQRNLPATGVRMMRNVCECYMQYSGVEEVAAPSVSDMSTESHRLNWTKTDWPKEGRQATNSMEQESFFRS